MHKYSDNPIENYAMIVLEYLKISEMVSQCKTANDWQRAADMANLYLPPNFFNENTDLELYNQVMQEWLVVLKNVSYDLLAKIKTQDNS